MSGPEPIPEAGDIEREVGIETYATSQPGIGGKLRAQPQDFVVDEVGRLPPRAMSGRFTIARVRAVNWENNRLMQAMARDLSIGRGRIGFAGTKDKRAVTTQFFSFKASPDRVEGLDVPGVEVLDTYSANRPLSVGKLLGNRFTITVRNLDPKTPEEIEAELAGIKARLDELGGFPNYFGLQRFGVVRPITHRVGAALVRGDCERAVVDYVTSVNPLEPEEERRARTELGESRDWSGALEDFPARLTFERTLVYHLAHEPGDFVGALRKLPDNLLQMFVHAYQSHLFNRMLSRRLEAGLPLNQPVEGDIVLPVDRHGNPFTGELIRVNHFNLPKITRRCQEGRAWVTGLLFGIRSSFAKGPMGDIEREIVESESLRRKDFVIYHLPHISSFGLRRALLCRPRNLVYRVRELEPVDEHYHMESTGPGEAIGQAKGQTGTVAQEEAAKSEETGRNGELGVEFAFTLPKGAYATMLLREFMKARSPTDY